MNISDLRNKLPLFVFLILYVSVFAPNIGISYKVKKSPEKAIKIQIHGEPEFRFPYMYVCVTVKIPYPKWIGDF